MSEFNQIPRMSAGGGNGGPPGQELLSISLSLLAAVLGTPYLFSLIGPVVERLVYEAYGWRELSGLMYYASYGLSAVVIYTVARMALWYAIAALVAFAALRLGAGEAISLLPLLAR